MLGRVPGRVPDQSESLAQLFADDGWAVRLTSPAPNRLHRLVDLAITTHRWIGDYDIAVQSVYSGPAFGLVDAGSLAPQRAKAPLVMVLHGGDLPVFANRHPRWFRRVLDRADHLVAPSPFLATALKASAGREIDVIPNVIDLSRQHWRPRDTIAPRLLWMRSFHAIYDPQTAIRVVARLQADLPNVVLTMAGQDKGELDGCRRLARDLSCESVVDFPGFLGADQKQQAFADHDIFLNTSTIDNTPVALIEAAANGLALVSTNAGGIPHLFPDGTHAVLRDVGRVDQLSEAVLEVTNDPLGARSRAETARLVAVECGWGAVKRRWEALFASLLHENSSVE